MDQPRERFSGMPRPLHYVRVRLYRGGQAEYIHDVLEDERDALMKELGELRGQGLPEDHADVRECASGIRHLNNALRDIQNGMVELAGPMEGDT